MIVPEFKSIELGISDIVNNYAKAGSQMYIKVGVEAKEIPKARLFSTETEDVYARLKDVNGNYLFTTDYEEEVYSQYSRDMINNFIEAILDNKEES